MRRVEDFICAQCGAQVQGNGYTNHCPRCLYSLHVDIQPGDRGEHCRGLMEPVRIEWESDGYQILHHCLVCGHEKRNQAVPEDDFETLVAVAAAIAKTNQH